MTDHSPFVPPEPLPRVPAPPVPPMSASMPPPVGPPIAGLPPTQPSPTAPRPSRPGRTALIVVAICLGVGGLLTGIGFLAVGITNMVVEALEDDGSQPLTFGEEAPPLAGDPGESTPVRAEACPEVCFTPDDLGLTIPPTVTFTALGLPQESASWAKSQHSSVRNEYMFSARSWTDTESTPQECFPVYFFAPIAVAFDESPTNATDRIDFTGSWQDATGYSYASTATRIFPDAAAASAHLAEVNRLVGACSTYSTGTGVDYWSADVSLAPALDLPETTAAAGWVEQGAGGRFYVFDVQRSNLVVRTTLWSTGASSEQEFRDFVAQLARQLAAIDTTAQ